MSGMTVTDEILEAIALNCPLVKDVLLPIESGPDVSDDGVQKVIKKCHHIERLFLPFNAKITMKGVAGIKEALPNLETLGFNPVGATEAEVNNLASSLSLREFVCPLLENDI